MQGYTVIREIINPNAEKTADEPFLVIENEYQEYYVHDFESFDIAHTDRIMNFSRALGTYCIEQAKNKEKNKEKNKKHKKFPFF